jgi:type IV pilus biogenesis protein CpaD/CtpE
MRASVLFVVAALALCAVASTPVSVQGQVPIPYRPDGWAIGGPLEAPIHMNVFVDLL